MTMLTHKCRGQNKWLMPKDKDRKYNREVTIRQVCPCYALQNTERKCRANIVMQKRADQKQSDLYLVSIMILCRHLTTLLLELVRASGHVQRFIRPWIIMQKLPLLFKMLHKGMAQIWNNSAIKPPWLNLSAYRRRGGGSSGLSCKIHGCHSKITYSSRLKLCDFSSLPIGHLK